MPHALETELERACKLLELATPDAMEASAAALESVARDLALRRDSIVLDEARRLHSGAAKARLLLDLAARFHARCRDITAAMSAGYTAHGAPASLGTRGSVSISG
jgi:hypothetical protein